MKKLSQIIEGRPKSVTNDIDVTDKNREKWNTFLKREKLSKDFWTLSELLVKNNVTTAKDWDDLRYGNPSDQRAVANKLGIDIKDLAEIADLIKSLGGELNAIPMSISDAARESIMKNPSLLDDLLVDRQSNKGVQAMIKQYTPMIKKMVFKYAKCTPLDKAELLSICKIALLDATRKYMRGDKETNMQFTGFVQYVMFQAIQNELHENGYTIRFPQSEQERLMKAGSLNTIFSYDSVGHYSDDDYAPDKLGFLGTADEKTQNLEDPDKFKMLMKLIEDTFGSQKAEVYFMYFGINGYKKMQGKDIAKKIGKSPAMIVKICKEITEWLKSQAGHGKVGELIDYLNDVYTEGLMTNHYYTTKDIFYDTLVNDDIYLTLQEAVNSLTISDEMIDSALSKLDIESANFIYKVLEKGYSYLDSNFRRNKEAVIDFLYELYPNKNLSKASDVELLDLMNAVLANK